MAELRHGSATLHDDGEQPCGAQLQLTEDYLHIKKEELVYTTSNSDHLDPALLSKERIVTIEREKVGGLGLSVKGGAEHNLPVLISRIFKDQAADKTGQLFVGDAILRVNSVLIENSRHDDAVNVLKNAGEKVTLSVKYFRPASLFLSRYRRSEKDEENNHAEVEEPRLERQWTKGASIPLQYAYITRYLPGTDKESTNGFELFSMDGASSGLIECEDGETLRDWMQNITHNINLINNQNMVLANKLLVPSQQIVHTCWAWERVSPTKHWHKWKAQYLALKGSSVHLFNSPPLKARDWAACDNVDKIYECMLKILKDSELLDGRQHCFSVETGRGESHYMSVESRQELLRVEKAWHRANYLAIKYLGSKTFGCTWRDQICGLTLDLNAGFSLYESESKSYMWNYRFSQLKGSSDDSKSKLKLHFLDDSSQQIETREIECSSLQALLYSMHAFLSAKLASVDPSFLINL